MLLGSALKSWTVMGENLMRRSEGERDTARPCIIGPDLVLSCRPGLVRLL
jgi:hypothetical protein